ncbi:site-2 protease family protein [Haloplanus pelagicus]|jgi:membrane-associated protease RseP (regulator of RpoE activity)|uniref:site-2 protease family protein n=1 Tax=Haloplanus pelagicus TaxID=2949995 RepID=UPI00203AF469|nr:site-2 protease family protein [Haloplanus sp. HW8-1]
MVEPTVPYDLPDPGSLAEAFLVYEVDVVDGQVRYYGEPTDSTEAVVRTLAPLFRERGYRITVQYETGEHVLVATERSTTVDGVPWVHGALFLATVLTTLFAGSQWYGIDVAADPFGLVRAWPFALSVVGVLAIHELGHYTLSRHHDVEATLPYFIPVPNVLGTLGAVIRMNDTIPSRRALFDIGVAGPLAGLAATVVVTAVGVSLPPVDAPASAVVGRLELGYPLLITGIATLLDEPVRYGAGTMVNPVVVGGWIGAFVTFLNLLPVGQLDGAHVTRALLGDRMGSIQRLVPAGLFGLAGYLVVFESGRSAQLWAFWGLLSLLFLRLGSATPVDETPVGRRRRVIGLATLLLGIACFTPTPIAFAG